MDATASKRTALRIVWMWPLVAWAGCGPDQETLRREAGDRRLAAVYAAMDARTQADIHASELELAHMRATNEMYERKSWADMQQNGSLGFHARQWLDERATSADGTLESLIAQGTEITTFTEELSVALNEACDDDSAAEAFAVGLHELGRGMASSAIAEQPQLEGIVDARVVTRELGHTVDKHTGLHDWGYLVAWLHEGAVVGFVYHSRHALTLDELNSRAPACVRMVQAALPQRKP